MRNLIFDSCYKAIKYDKKKYKASLISIIVATFLITIVFNIVYNMKSISIQMQKNSSGDFDFSYIDVNNDVYNNLQSDEEVDENSISRVYFNTKNIFNELNGISVDILSCDKNFFDIMPMKIKEGSMPSNGNEVILEEWCLNEYGNNLKIGDKITTNSKGQAFTYTITGFYENFATSQYTKKVNFYTLIDRDKLDCEMENIFFKLKNPKDVSRSFSKYREKVGSEHFSVNEPLLILKGEHESIKNNESIQILMILLIPTIVISIVMISNIINILLLQGVPFYRNLRIIGANRKFIFKHILEEVLIISLLAIPIGELIAYIIVKVIGFIIGPIQNCKISISVKYSIGAFIIALLVSLISGFVSAQGIKKMHILDSNFSIEKGFNIKKKRKININNLIFDISDRSMKINKKKYYLTLISIVFSSFLVFIYFSATNMFVNIFKILGEDLKTEYNVYSTNDTNGDFEKTYKMLSSVDGIEKIYKDYNLITGENININGTNKKSLIHIYDKSRLLNSNMQNYLIKGSSEDLENKVIVVKSNAVKDLNVGDKIKLFNSNKGAEVGMVVSRDPFKGINEYDDSNDILEYKPEIKIIMSDEMYVKFSKENLTYYGFDIIFDKSKNKEETENQIQNYVNANLSDMRYIDKTEVIEKFNDQIKIIFISFTFLLIIIIGTSIVMLYNTTKSNVIMRKNEILMLRAIGMNMKQVKQTIICEALIYSVKGSLIAIIIGYVFNEIIYSMLQSIGPIRGQVPIYIPIITLVIICLASIISVIPTIKDIKNERVLK